MGLVVQREIRSSHYPCWAGAAYSHQLIRHHQGLVLTSHTDTGHNRLPSRFDAGQRTGCITYSQRSDLANLLNSPNFLWLQILSRSTHNQDVGRCKPIGREYFDRDLLVIPTAHSLHHLMMRQLCYL
jgi:hypothetical protein